MDFSRANIHVFFEGVILRYALVCIVGIGLPGAATSFAQSADGSASARPAADSLENKPITFASTSLVQELSWQPGVFGHSFGTSGWPDGVAPLGRDPNSVALSVGAIPLNDLFTGRPRFDLVPLAWLETISLDPDLEVRAVFDPLDSNRPMTNVRYESSGNGSQAVRVLHVQNRSWVADSSRTGLQTAFGYAGEGARGEYDGTRLRRAREITARIGYRTPAWHFELFEMASRRSVEAHAGVLPFTGAAYSSIYQRLGATVADETARRRTLRNDLLLSGSTAWKGYEATLSGIWTVETLDFRGESLVVKGVMSKTGLTADIGHNIGGSRAAVQLRSYRDAYKRGSAFADGAPTSRWVSAVTGSLSGQFGPLSYSGMGGAETSEGRSWSSITGQAGLSKGPFQADLTLHRAGRDLNWHERSGFGTVLPLATADPSPIEQFIRASLTWRSGVISLGWTGMLDVNRDALLTRQTDESGGASVLHLPGASSATVNSFILGFRDNAKRGVWAQISPVLRTTTTDASSALAEAWSRSMPKFWASATLGWRARMFGGDLDLNTYARARYWGEMGGLRLHTPTGLLVLPLDGTETLESNWLMDFVIEAGVREATIFLSYENAFSGTNLLFGNLIVPDYPLPQQRTRFGVFWPIPN